ncbi:sulfite exporter TauE/SafE family protein [Candidatus Methylocalor cossyra]|uniref:Probable membrane transporter protein n=1 Tax=Candidatus Methylocalor cossyra TaxID=3108543 RepID=A0ABM9NHT1_9GAMM
MTLVVVLALVIGLLLGLLGGGGSILTVPVLVYLMDLEPKTAIATSLVVVGTTSLIAMIGHARGGRVCWLTGLVFGLAGMAGAYGGGRLAALLPGQVLLLLFAAVMLGTAGAMLRGRPADHRRRLQPVCPRQTNFAAVLFDGLLVGALNGLVGVGGGFVIVPALHLLGELPMHAAVGTSLLVIAMNSAAALLGYASHVRLDFHLVGIVTGAAVVGSLVGGLLSRRLSGTALRRGFGLFVIAIAGYLLYRELNWGVLADAWRLALAHRDFLRGFGTAAGLIGLYGLWRRLHRRARPRLRKAGRRPGARSPSVRDGFPLR